MTDLPRTTAARLDYLTLFASETIHVYRDPAKPGAGISRAVLDKLRRNGLVRLGDYKPLHGKPVVVTDLGRDVLVASTRSEA